MPAILIAGDRDLVLGFRSMDQVIANLRNDVSKLQKTLTYGRLARISRVPVRNAHRVPTFVGASRESFRPGKLLPKQPATGDLLTK